jgi:uncharacterized membrane protein
METTFTTTTNSGTWNVVPTNPVAGFLLFIVFMYLLFRHFVFILMIMDIVNGWLKRFRWFPGPGKRLKGLIHWIVAVGLLIGYMYLARAIGWLHFVSV